MKPLVYLASVALFGSLVAGCANDRNGTDNGAMQARNARNNGNTNILRVNDTDHWRNVDRFGMIDNTGGRNRNGLVTTNRTGTNNGRFGTMNNNRFGVNDNNGRFGAMNNNRFGVNDNNGRFGMNSTFNNGGGLGLNQSMSISSFMENKLQQAGFRNADVLVIGDNVFVAEGAQISDRKTTVGGNTLGGNNVNGNNFRGNSINGTSIGGTNTGGTSFGGTSNGMNNFWGMTNDTTPSLRTNDGLFNGYGNSNNGFNNGFDGFNNSFNNGFNNDNNTLGGNVRDFFTNVGRDLGLGNNNYNDFNANNNQNFMRTDNFNGNFSTNNFGTTGNNNLTNSNFNNHSFSRNNLGPNSYYDINRNSLRINSLDGFSRNNFNYNRFNDLNNDNFNNNSFINNKNQSNGITGFNVGGTFTNGNAADSSIYSVLQRNFGGMKVYRVTDNEAKKAMQRLDRNLTMLSSNNTNSTEIAKDLEIVLKSVRNQGQNQVQNQVQNQNTR